MSWAVLISIILAVLSHRVRFDVAAFCGLLFFGLSGMVQPVLLFSGFASPALFTIAVVLILSQVVTDSGLFIGLGRAIQQRIYNPRIQLLVIFLTTASLSAFMNNVGAVGLLIPTSKRMAERVGAKESDFGLALAYAALLGGSATLIGTGSNLIVSSFRGQAIGMPFRIFDFLPHGMTIIMVGVLFLFVCEECGWILHPPFEKAAKEIDLSSLPPLPARDMRKISWVILPLIPAIWITAIGLLPPVLAFGALIVLWGAAGVLDVRKAYDSLNLSVLVIVGCMLSVSTIMQSNGSFVALVELLTPMLTLLPTLWTLFLIVLITCALANVMDNAVAAVIVSPIMVQLNQTGSLAIPLDALLMAVAAGASLSILIPTNKVTLVVQGEMGFTSSEFIHKGLAIAGFSSILATLVIWLVWS